LKRQPFSLEHVKTERLFMAECLRSVPNSERLMIPIFIRLPVLVRSTMDFAGNLQKQESGDGILLFGKIHAHFE
jgi:hypothetical protein